MEIPSHLQAEQPEHMLSHIHRTLVYQRINNSKFEEQLYAIY